MSEQGALLGYVVLEPDDRTISGFDLMLGTPMFEPDDLASAEACLEADAFIAEVRSR